MKGRKEVANYENKTIKPDEPSLTRNGHFSFLPELNSARRAMNESKDFNGVQKAVDISQYAKMLSISLKVGTPRILIKLEFERFYWVKIDHISKKYTWLEFSGSANCLE